MISVETSNVWRGWNWGEPEAAIEVAALDTAAAADDDGRVGLIMIKWDENDDDNGRRFDETEERTDEKRRCATVRHNQGGIYSEISCVIV